MPWLISTTILGTLKPRTTRFIGRPVVEELSAKSAGRPLTLSCECRRQLDVVSRRLISVLIHVQYATPLQC